jgi:hypothetical protein
MSGWDMIGDDVNMLLYIGDAGHDSLVKNVGGSYGVGGTDNGRAGKDWLLSEA